MTNTKLATFRIDEKVWEQFITKAKKAGDTASGVLIRTIHTYLEGQQIAESESQPGIYLAIAPDHQITYIDRAVRSNQWIPPYQLRHSDSRFEWIQSTDPTLLSAIEDVLIEAFDPALNFRPKTQSAQPEPPIDQDPDTLPSEIKTKIHELLVRGMPSTAILNALDSLSHPLIEVKVEPTPTPPPPTLQIDTAIIKHLEALTLSITTLKDEVNGRIDDVETKIKQRQRIKEPSLQSDKKNEETPKLFKGTASLYQLPKQPESTRSLAKRWQITEKTLTRQRQRYENRPEGFFQYALEKEQGKFGWLYDGEKQLFYAVTELPETIKKSEASASDPDPDSTTSTTSTTKSIKDASTSNSNASKDLPKPLTAEQLGHRFRNPKNHRPISGKAIEMALRRHVNPEDFANYSQERDPNGYRWQFDEQKKVFICLGKATTQITQ